MIYKKNYLEGLFANEQLNVPILKWYDQNMNFAHHYNANINLIIKIFIFSEIKNAKLICLPHFYVLTSLPHASAYNEI